MPSNRVHTFLLISIAFIVYEDITKVWSCMMVMILLFWFQGGLRNSKHESTLSSQEYVHELRSGITEEKLLNCLESLRVSLTSNPVRSVTFFHTLKMVLGNSNINRTICFGWLSSRRCYMKVNMSTWYASIAQWSCNYLFLVFLRESINSFLEIVIVWWQILQNHVFLLHLLFDTIPNQEV